MPRILVPSSGMVKILVTKRKLRTVSAVAQHSEEAPTSRGDLGSDQLVSGPMAINMVRLRTLSAFPNEDKRLVATNPTRQTVASD